MNINVLNEDNLFFFRKVLEQVPSQESHSGLYGLRSLRSAVTFPHSHTPSLPVPSQLSARTLSILRTARLPRLERCQD